MKIEIFKRKIKNAPKVLIIWPIMRFLRHLKGVYLMYTQVINWWVYPLSLLNLLQGNKLMVMNYKNGLKVIFRPNTYDAIINCDIFGYGEYDSFNSDEKFERIIDIGAQTGVFALRALSSMGNKKVKLTCVEAIRGNFDILKKNIESNGFSASTHLINKAAWGKSGQVIKIYKNADNSGGHSIFKGRKHKDINIEEVQTISLENIMGGYNCDLLKVDIEGSEYDLIYNAPLDILQKISKIIMEVHGSDQDINNLAKFIEDSGFRVTIHLPHLYAQRLR